MPSVELSTTDIESARAVLSALIGQTGIQIPSVKNNLLTNCVSMEMELFAKQQPLATKAQKNSHQALVSLTLVRVLGAENNIVKDIELAQNAGLKFEKGVLSEGVNIQIIQKSVLDNATSLLVKAVLKTPTSPNAFFNDLFQIAEAIVKATPSALILPAIPGAELRTASRTPSPPTSGSPSQSPRQATVFSDAAHTATGPARAPAPPADSNTGPISPRTKRLK